MSKIATKVSVAIATCGIALAAGVAAPAAQAAPILTAPAAPVTIVQPALTPQFMPQAAIGTSVTSTPPVYVYVGPTRTDAQVPSRATFFTFNPLVLVPNVFKPFFGWFTKLNFEACFLGAGFRVGPYGTISGFVGRSC